MGIWRKGEHSGKMILTPGVTTGRWSGKTLNVVSLPKSPHNFAMKLDGPFEGVNYEELEWRLYSHYSTDDGYIMADILRETDVVYNGHKAKIRQFDPTKDSVEIEFMQPGLIPPTMWVPSTSLQHQYGGRVINKERMCPKCELPWKETQGFSFSYFDCPACGLKKEEA